MNVNELKNKIEELVSIHNSMIQNKNVFCTSLELAEITGKRHDNVVRDIEESFEKMRNLDVLIFEEPFATLAKARETIDLNGLKVITYIPTAPIADLDKNFRLSEGSYLNSDGNMYKVYYMDEVFYLTMMNKYNDYIRFCMAIYYDLVKNSIPYDITELAKNDLSVLEEALDMLLDKQIYDSEQRNSFTKQINMAEGKNYTPIMNDHKSKILLEELKGMGDFFAAYGVGIHDNENPLTSVNIARINGKHHRNVTRDIKSIIDTLIKNGVSNEEIHKHFTETTYLDGSNRTQRMYVLSTVGFITVLGRYMIEINYKLAKFYVNTKDYTINFDRVVASGVDIIYEARKLKESEDIAKKVAAKRNKR